MLVDLASMYQTKYGSVLYGGLQLSRQNQKPHGKNKIPHGKTKNLTAKTKYVTAKPKTSRQKQNTSRQNQKPHGKNKIPHSKTKNLKAKPNTSHSKNKIAIVLPWVFAFFHSIWFCREVFGFAVRFLVLP